MATDFRRKIDGMLRDAERTVTGGGSGGGGAGASSFGPRSSVNTTATSSSLVPFAGGSQSCAAAAPTYRASSEQPHWGGGGTASRAGSAAADQQQQQFHQDPLQAMMNNNTTSRIASENSVHVQHLQDELAELRRELRAERDNREALTNSIVRRVKDELRAETIVTAREQEAQVNEMNAHVRTRLADVETMAQACARRCDEVTRAVKVCNNDIFDMSERNATQFSEMKSQTDAAFAMASSTKVDCARAIEKERMALQHRVEVELVRFAEIEREQRNAVDTVKDRLASELKDVTQSVDKMVSDAWDTRARSFIATVNEALDAVKNQSRTVASTMAESTTRVENLGKQVKQLQSLDTQVFDQRLTSIETVIPNLSTRVDRTEKRSESLLDSNSRLTASVDVLREAADRAAAHAVRCVERLQSFEGTLSDRDSRLTSVESALVHIQGAERVKGELESVKRSISRVESIADAMKSNNQRDERVVETLERNMDSMTARWEGLDSKLAKTATKCEALDQRVATVSERALSVESTADKLNTAVQQSANELQMSVGILTRRCDGIESKTSSQLEQQESAVCDVRNRAMQVEATCNAMRISVESASQSAQSARGEADKLLRKVNTLEAAVQEREHAAAVANSNNTASAGQQQILEERLGSLTNTCAGLRNKVDLLQKQQHSLAQRQEELQAEQRKSPPISPRSHSSSSAGAIDSAAFSRVQAATELLQNSNHTIKNQLSTIEQRLTTVESQKVVSAGGGGSSSSSGSGSSEMVGQRLGVVEQEFRSLKSKMSVSNDKLDRFESMFHDVDERIDQLEDNVNRMSDYRARSSSSSGVAANNTNANQQQQQQQQQPSASSSTTTTAAINAGAGVIISGARVAGKNDGGFGMVQPSTTTTSSSSAAAAAAAQGKRAPIMAPVPTPRNDPTPRNAASVGGLSPMSNIEESPPGAQMSSPEQHQHQQQDSSSPVGRIQNVVAEAWRGSPHVSPTKAQQQQQQQQQQQPAPKKSMMERSQLLLPTTFSRNNRRGDDNDASSSDAASPSDSSTTDQNTDQRMMREAQQLDRRHHPDEGQLQLGGRRVATPLPSDAFGNATFDDEEYGDEDDDIEEEILDDEMPRGPATRGAATTAAAVAPSNNQQQQQQHQSQQSQQQAAAAAAAAHRASSGNWDDDESDDEY